MYRETRRYIRRTDREIALWARKYLQGKENLFSLEKKLSVPHSTLWWCFHHRLHKVDTNLYLRVLEKLDYNKHNKVRKEKEA